MSAHSSVAKANAQYIDRATPHLESVLQQTTDEGVRSADLITEALSNPPELVEQFGTVNINASALALPAGNRLRKQTNDAAKNITDPVSENLLRLMVNGKYKKLSIISHPIVVGHHDSRFKSYNSTKDKIS